MIEDAYTCTCTSLYKVYILTGQIFLAILYVNPVN